jgi:tetratricopeptide (TPR) repeat protein
MAAHAFTRWGTMVTSDQQRRDQARRAAVDAERAVEQQQLDRSLRDESQLVHLERLRQRELAASEAALAAGDLVRATECLEALAILIPDDGPILWRLASCKLARGDARAAERYADRAVKLDIRDLPAFRERARARTALGKLAAARTDLEYVLRISPNDRQAWLALAELAEVAGQPLRALHAWERLVGGDDALASRAHERLQYWMAQLTLEEPVR